MLPHSNYYWSQKDLYIYNVEPQDKHEPSTNPVLDYKTFGVAHPSDKLSTVPAGFPKS